jgi:2-dehydro-3-deoxyphosphogluconate aldolase/(4S)-4-hydroxy-2-oxoglutarate aldolase
MPSEPVSAAGDAAAAPVDLLAELAVVPAVAVLRAADTRGFRAVSRALVSAGVRLLEYTLTTRGALDAVTAAREHFGDRAVIGVGTVLTGAEVDKCVAAGARFVVSPVARPDVVSRCHEHGIPVVPGALTPSEVVAAWEQGVAAVKVSPVACVGGAAYVAQLKAFLPGIPLLPTGGVQPREIGDYLAAGAAGIGLSGSEVKAALAGTLSEEDLTAAVKDVLARVPGR